MQNINLYQVERKRAGFQLDAHQMLQLLGIFGIGILLMTTYDVIQYFTSKHEVTQLEKQQLAYNAQLKDAEGKVIPVKTREQALQDIQILEKEKQDNLSMLSNLKTLESEKTQGFSKYLKALATKTNRGIWFTRFKFQNQGGMTLEGRSINPEEVPKLMELLSSSPVFSGKTFTVFKLGIDKKTQEVVFALQTGKGFETETGKIVESAS